MKATTRKPGGRAGTVCRPNASCSSAPATWSSSRSFIEEKSPAEQRIAREQLRQIVHYADSAGCRRVELLRYFGETFQAANCGGCDNCLNPRDTFDGTVAAQKFLSCVYRIWQKSGFGFGLNHVIGVLTGSDSDQIQRRRHKELSTYGIGHEHSRPHWQAIGRELVRLGYLRETDGQIQRPGTDAKRGGRPCARAHRSP